MGRIIDTAVDGPATLPQQESDWAYNGIDCLATRQCLDAMLPQLDQLTSATYSFSRALQGPVLDMRVHGVLVDQTRRSEVIDELYERASCIEGNLERIVLEGCGELSFNWRSNSDLQRLFYDRLGIPAIYYQGRVTVNRNALEKLTLYPDAEPIVKHILALRDIHKKIAVLKTDIDPDGRIRTSYNIAGTDTGRFSSSQSEFGTGGNLQNIEESLRSILVADPGTKWAKLDAKSGESYCVGAIEWNLFGDGRYLDAIETGDIHTAVARLVWENLPWTGNLKADKAIASRPFYRGLSYRDTSKRLGHGSSYGGQPPTLAAQTHIPLEIVEAFQHRFFSIFPAHQRWHAWTKDRLASTGTLVNLLGRKRQFFGRRNSMETLRSALAYDPQGSLADIVNRAMLRVWRAGARVVLHDHDALTIQFPEADEGQMVPWLLAELVEPVPLANGRTLRIPYDCETGWNKAHATEDNPDGLRPWTGPDTRVRTPTRGLLDRRVRGVY